MCGIAGRFNDDRAQSVDRDLLESMTDAVMHRGPDAAGYYHAPGVGLGHRRLSIIDLATGDQPIGNEDGQVQVVFNGEIYNFAEVRTELIARGHRFRTGSDTEIIVHGYEEWGERCVERFRGMFAFALYDARAHRLLLARDRLGVKPMYYAQVPGGIVFGSEIKSLLQDPAVPREWRPEAIDTYLTLLFIPAPQTIYAGVHKLPPAHTLVAERGTITLRRYWDLEFTGTGDPRREEEYLEELDALLREAVSLRLISDVPLGAFLSGGIDSSTVVSYMKETSATTPVTIAVGFDNAAYDETSHAEAVARHLGCEFHALVASPEIETLLPTLAWHFDEPFADSSAIPTYYVSRAARQLVTVALSGDGGDELWAGYAHHRVEQAEQRARGALGPGRHLASLIGRALPLSVRGARSLRHIGASSDYAYAMKHASNGTFEQGAKDRLYSSDFTRALGGADPLSSLRDAYNAFRSADPMDRAMYADARVYMVDDVLTKVDRMSMAVSLEAREPLLDHKLLEFAARVPVALKLKDGRSKYLLRRILERRVPRAIVDRGKSGFAAPIGDWLRGPLADMTSGLLLDGRLRDRGLFNQHEVQRLWDDHRTGRVQHPHRLWQLVMLELWFRTFIDAGGAARAQVAA